MNAGTHFAGNRGTVLLAVLTYAVAFSAAKITGPDIGGINVGVEDVSSGTGGALAALGALLPLGYAFGAGMVAAVNPCGFALLPAYLAMYLGRHAAEATRSAPVRLLHAARVGLTMSAGFTLLFVASGALLSVATTALVQLFPWLGISIGVVLVALGARLANGHMLYASVGERIADRLGGRARRTGIGGYFVYGVAFGAASLSCTLPIFLAVVGSAFASGDYFVSATQFLLYSLGMGVVVVGATLGLALFGDAVLVRARCVTRYVQPASALLLLLAGAYIIYYWLTLGGLLAAVHLS